MFERPTIRLGATALAGLLLVTACSGTNATPSPQAPTEAPATNGTATDTPATQAPATSGAATDAPTEPPADLSGSIVISGSSTVQPISTRIQELFNEQHPGVAISVDGPGTGDGFALFCSGETDISDASRPISESEIADCEAAGVEFVELKVAIDGIAVITSATNDSLTCLTFADLYALIGPESTGFSNWADSQAIAAELGSPTTLPDAPLTVTAPGEESGTYDSFVELAIEGFAEERGQDPVSRPDYTASANDTVIIEGVAGTADNSTTLGWVGYAFAEENLDRVKMFEIDSGESGCVAPTPETISSNEYPLARDLFIYVNKAKAAEKPELAAYVDYYVADGTISTALETVPYVPLPAEGLAETQAAWAAR